MFNPLGKMMKKRQHQHNHECGCHKCKCQTSAYDYEDCDFFADIPFGSVHLNELKPGDKATVLTIIGNNRFHFRLMEMGFVAGKQIEVIRFAPIGDPIEIDILGTKLSLRKAEAAMIIVQKVKEDGK